MEEGCVRCSGNKKKKKSANRYRHKRMQMQQVFDQKSGAFYLSLFLI